jgi:hypothetical protein
MSLVSPLPILHPTIWEGPEVVVMINNTKLMDMAAGGNFTISREINDQGLGAGVSTGFSKQNSTGGPRVSPTALQGKDLDSCKGCTVAFSSLWDEGVHKCHNSLENMCGNKPVLYQPHGTHLKILVYIWLEYRGVASMTNYATVFPSPPILPSSALSAGLW